MPKQLINLIGILVCVAVLALGVFLVAMPLATQALGIYGQASQVTQTNTLYRAQVQALTKDKANKAETDASVASLRAQIPATPELDAVFELIAQASQSSGAVITSATAGASAPFAVRADATSLSAQTGAPAPAPSPSATADGVVGKAQQDAGAANAQTAQTNAASGQTATSSGAGTGAAGQTRTQISFSINVTATDINEAVAYLDALRAGPRLLSNITSTVSQNGSGTQIAITALTYVDGVAQSTMTGAK